MTIVLQAIRSWLGWCPRTHQQSTMKKNVPVLETDGLAGGRDIPCLSFGWTNRYRTKTLAFALCMTGAGTALYATATGDRFALFGVGLILALFLYLGDAVRYWQAFETVARKGTAPEFDWRQVTVVRCLPVIGVALILGFFGAIILGLVPGISLLTVNGFLAGFAAIGWYHLMTLVLWERKTGIILFSQKDLLYHQM